MVALVPIPEHLQRWWKGRGSLEFQISPIAATQWESSVRLSLTQGQIKKGNPWKTPTETKFKLTENGSQFVMAIWECIVSPNGTKLRGALHSFSCINQSKDGRVEFSLFKMDDLSS